MRPREIPHFNSIIVEMGDGDLTRTRHRDSAAFLASARIRNPDG
jgi:hypothetical protein